MNTEVKPAYSQEKGKVFWHEGLTEITWDQL